MNEQDEEYETMKLGAEVIKERIDKVDELEKRIDSLEKRLHSNDLKIGIIVNTLCVVVDTMHRQSAALSNSMSAYDDMKNNVVLLEDAGDDIVHEDWW